MTPAARNSQSSQRSSRPVTRISSRPMDNSPFVEVRVTQRFSAPAARVFDAWIDPGTAGQWLFATASSPMSRVMIDARAGGAFRFVERKSGVEVEHGGEFVELSRPRRIVFTLVGRKRSQDRTRVVVAIAPEEAGCTLTLVHEGVLRDEAPRTEGRWAGMLYGLGTLVG